MNYSSAFKMPGIESKSIDSIENNFLRDAMHA
jgi:hypothetical protein